ncbi:zinc transport system ATP-binding protein [Dysgonomonadaceae bacterium PH5-43]|nr:zinc transport system ATP-binding protein [Dysgonomonadaceae bacterium PH5-43]
MNKPLLEIKDLSAGYNNNIVIQNVNLVVYENDFLGIIGPNGGGKTTLIKVMVGLIKPTSGNIIFHLKEVKDNIGYMPQISYIDKRFPISVKDVVESGLMSQKGKNKTQKKDMLMQIVQETGIKDFVNKPIGELSGGQLQKVLLARAMVSRPKLLILDEPSTYIDKTFEYQFYELLEDFRKNTAIILVSHDIGTVVSKVKNIACVNETLHYHTGSNLSSTWLDTHCNCQFDIVGHGDIPHRVLKKH